MFCLPPLHIGNLNVDFLTAEDSMVLGSEMVFHNNMPTYDIPSMKICVIHGELMLFFKMALSMERIR